ncbi:MAG: hypothetical protein ABI693_32135 [Bryobacteraceae bacterium]
MPENRISQLTDRAVDLASSVREKTQEFGQAASNRIEDNRIAAASALRSAANTLHDKASKLPDGPQMAHSAAEKMEEASGYLKKNNTKRIVMDAGAILRRNPVPSLVAVGVVAFLIGRSFRRA